MCCPFSHFFGPNILLYSAPHGKVDSPPAVSSTTINYISFSSWRLPIYLWRPSLFLSVTCPLSYAPLREIKYVVTCAFFCDLPVLLARSFEHTKAPRRSFVASCDCRVTHRTPSHTPSRPSPFLRTTCFFRRAVAVRK